MNRKELEKKIIELSKENIKLKNLCFKSYLPKDEVLDYKLFKREDIRLNNFRNKIEELMAVNKELQRRNDELLEKIEKLKYKNKRYEKKKNNIKTKEYKLFRTKILERDNYTCQCCGNKERLQVHHIKSRKEYPELIMDENNCITLCIVCHAKTDSYLN